MYLTRPPKYQAPRVMLLGGVSGGNSIRASIPQGRHHPPRTLPGTRQPPRRRRGPARATAATGRPRPGPPEAWRAAAGRTKGPPLPTTPLRPATDLRPPWPAARPHLGPPRRTRSACGCGTEQSPRNARGSAESGDAPRAHQIAFASKKRPVGNLLPSGNRCTVASVGFRAGGPVRREKSSGLPAKS